MISSVSNVGASSLSQFARPRSGSTPGELTAEQQQVVRELKARDAEVRRHEQAHVAAAGDLVLSGPTYTYTTGPDGQRYATGGEVQIDTSPESTPEETIQKAERIVRAALAPAEPSGQDRRVAAQARSMAASARVELAQERYRETEEGDSATGLELDRIVA